jgi:hypothetical protein
MPSTPEWMPEDELRILQSAPIRASRADEEKLAMQIFRDNLPLAANVICHLAVNAEKETTRLNASKYVVERVMGRIGEAKPDAQSDQWEDLFGSVLREPTATERETGARVSRL